MLCSLGDYYDPEMLAMKVYIHLHIRIKNSNSNNNSV